MNISTVKTTCLFVLVALVSLFLSFSASVMAQEVDLSGRTDKALKRAITSKPDQIIEFIGVKDTGAEVGIALCSDPEGIDEEKVTQMIHKSMARGIFGVPFFIINDRFSLSGAQPADVLVEVLDRC